MRDEPPQRRDVPQLAGAPQARRSFISRAAGITAGMTLGLNRIPGAQRRSSAQTRSEEADRLIAQHIGRDGIAAAALLVRHAGFEFARAYGAAKIDTPFLIASPTKPMTASTVMWLQERGELDLADPVRKYLPDFKGEDRAAVTIRHLLTHTSGLPDMLPENVELRRRHAPLEEFVARTCRTRLLFRPGEKVSYQSMGILLAAAIAEKVSGQPLPELLRTKIYLPLGMTRTSLGMGGRSISDTAQCQIPESDRSDWDWNSAYWRNLGVPWGGAHSTVHDLAAFTEAFVRPGVEPWSQSTRRAMREVQTGTLRPSYGYGWRREHGAFGRTCSASTYGHHGSTGTVVWHDPESAVTCVLLTTLPAVHSQQRVITPVSEIVGRSS